MKYLNKDIYRRYEIKEILLNMLQKFFSLFRISINHKYCLTIQVNDQFIENIVTLNGYTIFQKLSYNDFVSYGDKI